jgi:hypothetical protein
MQVLYDVFSGSFGLIPAFVFLVTVVTLFLGLCNLLDFCSGRLRGLWITRPLRSFMITLLK